MATSSSRRSHSAAKTLRAWLPSSASWLRTVLRSVLNASAGASGRAMRPDLPCAIASRASTRRVVSYCFGVWLRVCLFCVAAGTAAAQTSALEDAGGAPTAEKTFLSAWSAPEPWRTDRFYLQTSLYTRHFNTDAYHNDH